MVLGRSSGEGRDVVRADFGIGGEYVFGEASPPRVSETTHPRSRFDPPCEDRLEVARIVNIESDERLVASARNGDERSFEELVIRHAPRIHAVVARMLQDRTATEDIVQEAFIRAWRALRSFRGDAQFSTWLYRIAVNEANRHLARDAKRELLPYEDVMMKVPDLTADVHGRAEANQTRRNLEQLLAELPGNYRAAVVLRDVEGLSNEEAADLLGLDLRNFKSRLHRGRMALRGQLEALAREP